MHICVTVAGDVYICWQQLAYMFNIYKFGEAMYSTYVLYRTPIYESAIYTPYIEIMNVPTQPTKLPRQVLMFATPRNQGLYQDTTIKSDVHEGQSTGQCKSRVWIYFTL
mgnify:CR=1 FL=1